MVRLHFLLTGVLLIALATDVFASVAEPVPTAAPAAENKPVMPPASPEESKGEQDDWPEGVPREMPRVVMVVVGDEEITVGDFMQLITRKAELIRPATTPEGKALIVRNMINQRLLRIAMDREGLLPENPVSEDYQRAYAALSKKYFPLPPVPEKKAQLEYYKSHPEAFGLQSLVRVSQIQIRYPEDADEPRKLQARKGAEAALARLNKGEPFPELAAELTENPTAKAKQGDLGFLPRKASPWLDAALQGLKPGQHTGVVESPVGYEILLLTEERDAVTTPFAQVQDQIVEQMQTQSLLQAQQAYLHKLAREVGVKIVQEGLEGAMP